MGWEGRGWEGKGRMKGSVWSFEVWGTIETICHVTGGTQTRSVRWDRDLGRRQRLRKSKLSSENEEKKKKKKKKKNPEKSEKPWGRKHVLLYYCFYAQVQCSAVQCSAVQCSASIEACFMHLLH